MAARLYRSRTDRILGGVCGGLGEYLGIDSTLVRLFFILLTLARGAGLLVYFVLWFITPQRAESRQGAAAESVYYGADRIAERARALADEVRETVRGPRSQPGPIVGLVLIVLGGIFLLQSLGHRWLWWLNLDVLWPALLVLAGLVLLVRRSRGG